jgi:hypothetical protein
MKWARVVVDDEQVAPRLAAALFCTVVDGILMAGLWLLVTTVASSTEMVVKGAGGLERRWASMASGFSTKCAGAALGYNYL